MYAEKEDAFTDRLSTATLLGEGDRNREKFGMNLAFIIALGEDQREQAILVSAYSDAFIRVDNDQWKGHQKR